MSNEVQNNKQKGTPAPWDEKRALEAMSMACVMREQCEYDLRLKMSKHNVDQESADRVIDYLTKHRFLNEKRFAGAYTRDKIRFNGWGKRKVALMLGTKHIPQHLINEALTEIDEDTYRVVLYRLVKSGARSLNLNEYADRVKLMRKLYAHGFESDLIQEVIADVRAASADD